jgi:hypothetical protein
MLGTCMLVPAYVGGRLNSERSDTNSDLMFISTLKPRTIVAGKFLSGVILVLLIFSACTPFMTFTYLLRGIDIPTILLIVVMDFVLALWGLAGVIFLAVIPAPRGVKGGLGMASFFGLVGLFSMGMSFTEAMLNFGFFLDVGSWPFWRDVLLALAIIVGQCALFFTWSAAILSPPSANKAVLVRLVMLLYIVGLGVACFLFSAALNSYTPLATWVTIAGLLGCLQLFISVNERERLGPRVRRAIPNSGLLRPLAFLFYSGSAGGVIFSTLVLLSTVGAGVLALALHGDMDVVPPTMSGSYMSSVGGGSSWGAPWLMVTQLRFAVLMGLYTYCYCLTAVLVRNVLLRGQLKPSFTWLPVLLLVGLGSVGPALIRYFVDQDQGRTYGIGGYDYWHLTDPFYTTGYALRESLTKEDALRESLTERQGLLNVAGMPFLLAWATLVSLANLPWLAGQVRRFKPVRQAKQPAPAPLPGRVDSQAIA